MADVVIETQITRELDDALARLAEARGKTKARLMQEALAEFVVSEEAFAAAVAEGRSAVDAGDVVDHDEVMGQMDALLADMN
jgi:predicted transcriptional regulator